MFIIIVLLALMLWGIWEVILGVLYLLIGGAALLVNRK